MPRGIPNTKPDPVPETAEPEIIEPVDTEPDPVPEEFAAEVEAATERRETFEAVRPDGTVVIVDRNIDTGEQTVTEK